MVCLCEHMFPSMVGPFSAHSMFTNFSEPLRGNYLNGNRQFLLCELCLLVILGPLTIVVFFGSFYALCSFPFDLKLTWVSVWIVLCLYWKVLSRYEYYYCYDDVVAGLNRFSVCEIFIVVSHCDLAGRLVRENKKLSLTFLPHQKIFTVFNICLERFW